MTSLSYQTIAGLVLLAGYVTLNFKVLPLVPTLRILPSLYRLMHPRLLSRKTPSGEKIALVATSPTALFTPHVSSSRVVLGDLDVNVHKSNSTFFADADVSRAELLTRMFANACVDAGKGGRPANLILASVQGRFLREIKPLRTYGVVSRILAWDGAGLYVVTYFVAPGWKLDAVEGELEGLAGPAAIMAHERSRKGVFAILVSRYVIRAGREKIRPIDLFSTAGMANREENLGDQGAAEKARAEGLEYVKGCMF